MSETIPAANPARPAAFEDRYRLYLDESGDHVFRETTEPAHRFLCLLGCWFRNPAYLQFHAALEGVKPAISPTIPMTRSYCTAMT